MKMPFVRTDVFRELKYFYVFTRSFGTTCFTIHGPVGDRTIRINSRKILVLFMNILMFLMFVFKTTTCFFSHLIQPFRLENVPTFFIEVFYLILVFTVVTTKLFRSEDVIKIYTTLQQTEKQLRGYQIEINYVYFRRFTHIIIGIQLVCMSFLVWEIPNFRSWISVFFYILGEMIVLSVINEMNILLLIMRYLVIELNKKIHKVTDRKILFKLLCHHSKIFEMNKEVNKVYNKILIVILITHWSLVYASYKFSTFNSEEIPYLWLVDVIAWNVFNEVSLVIIIVNCHLMKYQVR